MVVTSPTNWYDCIQLYIYIGSVELEACIVPTCGRQLRSADPYNSQRVSVHIVQLIMQGKGAWLSAVKQVLSAHNSGVYVGERGPKMDHDDKRSSALTSGAAPISEGATPNLKRLQNDH